jgi:5'-nucleotidase
VPPLQKRGTMHKPLIVISNDDGIKSEGLKVLYEAVYGLGDVLIAAPDRERSGASHSLSVIKPIRTKKVKFGRARAYAVSGTPVDCAKLALLSLAERKPDLLLSGINHGPNTAQFILYSGTIGAAAEAAILGIPALAFSIDSYAPENWTFAVDFIRRFVSAVLDRKIRMKKHTLLNVNLPYRPGRDVKGVKILPRGGNEYGETYKMLGRDKKGNARYRHIIMEKTKRKTDRYDADGVESGYVTVTSLKFDLNDAEFMKKMKKAGLNILTRL